MTRIIGGRAGGRRLQTPTGSATRPTSDRVREALFSSLESWAGSLSGLRLLDLYAGSGAVGLEGWSRGAGAVTLVESDRRTADLIRRNARSLGFADAAVIQRPVARTLADRAPADRTPADHASGPPYDIVFADPPYPLHDGAVAADLALLVEHGWLVPGALVVVERSTRSPEPCWPEGLRGTRHRTYGETTLWYAEEVAG